MPYAMEDNAAALTINRQTPRGSGPRQHQVMETRSYVCGQMKRNDPVTRRLIQYLSMQSSELLVLARDGKDGRILIEPPKSERWLKRLKFGRGRASKNDWEVVQEIGKPFFEQMDAERKWNLGFDDYYDVYVWSLRAGKNYLLLCEVIKNVCTTPLSLPISD